MKVTFLDEQTIINLRGDPQDPRFAAAIECALEVPLPSGCSTTSNGLTRLLWVGPDYWFAIGAMHLVDSMAAQLRQALRGLRHAVTDVSGGYKVLRIDGISARELLAQGCPLDLHPRSFKAGMCAGSVFYNASMWIWKAEGSPGFEVMFRRSFTGYVQLMIERGYPGLLKSRDGRGQP